jgi:putative ABC transport system permease protein
MFDFLRFGDACFHDTGSALRAAFKNRRFTILVALTLALGIGATTVIFTLVDAFLLRPLPFRQPDRLVFVEDVLRSGPVIPFSYGRELLAWKDHTRTLSSIAAYIDQQANFSDRNGARRVDCTWVTSSLFPLLGVEPAIGRGFLPGDDRPGTPPVVMLSHRFWEQHFGGSPSAIGKVIALDAKPYTIVGVLPNDFQLPDRYARYGFAPGLWIPMTLDERSVPVLVQVVGRLKPGVGPKLARVELDTIRQSDVPRGPTRSVRVEYWREEIAGGVRDTLLLFFAAVGLVLLIACANVANLFLVRTLARRKEMAVRLALGASRARLSGQLLIEATVVGLLGGAAGFALAFAAMHVFVASISASLPAVRFAGISARVLAFSTGISLVTGLVFGLAPALQASGASLIEALKEGSPGANRGNLVRNLLVICETALAVVLLMGSGLLWRSFLRGRGIDQGYNPRHILCMTIDLTPSTYPTPRAQAAFFERLMDKIGALPGVMSVGASTAPPFRGFGETIGGIAIEGQPKIASAIPYEAVSPDYFRTMGIPLLEGRSFRESDVAASPGVVVVNDVFARDYCPDRNCLGRRITSLVQGNEWMTVVGEVGAVRPWLQSNQSPQVYVPYVQAPEPEMTFLVRTRGKSTGWISALRSQVASLDKAQPPSEMLSLEQLRAEAFAPRWVDMLLMDAFAGLGLLLGAAGIYGVVSYSVTQRTREVGIRMSLGATPASVLGLVIGRGLGLVALGELLGLAAAFGLNRFIRGLLFQVSPTDPLTYAGALLVWLVVALLACYIPARRAAKVKPVVALRYE